MFPENVQYLFWAQGGCDCSSIPSQFHCVRYYCVTEVEVLVYVQGQTSLGDEKISLLVTTALKHGIAQVEGFLHPPTNNRRSQQGYRERLGNIMNGISPSNTVLRDELRDKIQSCGTPRGGPNRSPTGAQSNPMSPALSVVGDSIQLGLQRTVSASQRASQVVRDQFQR